MHLDSLGNPGFTEQEVIDELYRNPSLPLEQLEYIMEYVNVDGVRSFNNAVNELFLEDTPHLKHYTTYLTSKERFDENHQAEWLIPDAYKHYDIERWLWLQCKTPEERARVVEELEQYQARDLYPLLRYMKYLVDTMRKHNIVWGVGRGSSVASYVLYKIGIHKIDSLKYNLDWREFLR